VVVDMGIASAPAARLRYLGGFLGITAIGIALIAGMDGTWGMVLSTLSSRSTEHRTTPVLRHGRQPWGDGSVYYVGTY
jgi:hypothetical protein